MAEGSTRPETIETDAEEITQRDEKIRTNTPEPQEVVDAGPLTSDDIRALMREIDRMDVLEFDDDSSRNWYRQNYRTIRNSMHIDQIAKMCLEQPQNEALQKLMLSSFNQLELSAKNLVKMTKLMELSNNMAAKLVIENQSQ